MACEGNAQAQQPWPAAAGDGGEDGWLSPWGFLLSVVISCMDSAAAVRRKARSPRPRGTASRWWQGAKIPPPTPRAVKLRRRADPDDDPAEEERPPAAKRHARRRECFDCGVTETPLWRSGPMGSQTLCNACGIRFAESRRTEKRQRPRRSQRAAAAGKPMPQQEMEMESQLPVSGLVPVPVVLSTRCSCKSCRHWAAKEALRAATTAVAEEQQERPPVVSGSALSVPESSVRVPFGLDPAAHLPKEKSSPKQRAPQQPPTTDQSAPPPPLPPAQEEKKKGKKKRPYRPRKTGKRCLHCRSSWTPQWRGGPLGRSELCNACGMRYKKGGLMPEYRPLASPTFQPTEHSHLQWEVMHLHRRRKEGNRRRGHAAPPEQPGGAVPDPIPLDDDDDDDQVLNVNNDDVNLVLAVDHYHHHSPPPPAPEQKPQRTDGGAHDPIPLDANDDNDDDDEVLEPIPLEVRPPSPVPVHNEDNNPVLAIEYYHNHPEPPPGQQHQQPAAGSDNDELTHVLPCPVDNLTSSELPVGGIDDDLVANAWARDNGGPMGEPSSSLDLNLDLDLDLDLDPFLLGGTAAPMLIDDDEPFFFFL